MVTDLLNVLDGDLFLLKLLVNEDEGVKVAHSAIEQLIREPAYPLHYCLVKLQQPGNIRANRLK